MLNHAEWPFTDFIENDAPLSILFSGNDKFGWSVIIHEMVTGRYGYVLYQHVRGETSEVHASGAFDEPWAAMSDAIGEMRQRIAGSVDRG